MCVRICVCMCAYVRVGVREYMCKCVCRLCTVYQHKGSVREIKSLRFKEIPILSPEPCSTHRLLSGYSKATHSLPTHFSGHSQATLKPHTLLPSYSQATLRLPTGYSQATPSLPTGHSQATFRQPLGNSQATLRLLSVVCSWSDPCLSLSPSATVS